MHPKELVVRRGYEAGTREKFGDYYTTGLDEWAFVYDAAVEKIRRQMGVDSLKGFAIEQYPLGISAAGALLVYLDRTHHSDLRNICSVGRIDEGKFVWMDRFTLRNLEVFPSGHGDSVSLVETIDKCSSPMGARLLRTWLSLPVVDIKEISARQDCVQYLLEREDTLEDVTSRLGRTGDIERILGRVATGKILPREMLQLRRGLSEVGPLKKICADSGCDALSKLGRKMTGCDRLLKRIGETLDEDAASQIGKGPVIAKGVSRELDELREMSTGGKDYLLQMQQRESERTGIPSLKIAFNNVFGYYIEVRNMYKDKVPPEWVRKQTLVNAERYITGELKEYEEKILTAEDRIYTLETKIYQDLVEEVRGETRSIQDNGRALARLDVLAGFAVQAAERHYCRPEMNDSLILDIKNGRHPVIETLMNPGEEYVPNDVYLDSDSQQIIILTGPNMAGKSALLRQTALIVLMAQTGSFVPAESAKIGYFDKIFTRVGASDNISRGESTFMVEMLETSMILHNLSKRSLVLLEDSGRRRCSRHTTTSLMTWKDCTPASRTSISQSRKAATTSFSSER